MPEATPALLTLAGHHTWKLNNPGLLSDNQRPQTALPQWGLLALKLPMGFQEGLTSHLTKTQQRKVMSDVTLTHVKSSALPGLRCRGSQSRT